MRFLAFLNLCLALFLCAASFLLFSFSSKEPVVDSPLAFEALPNELPQSPYRLSTEAYKKLGEGPFSLKWEAPKVALPDLRGELNFFGKNERPDVKKGRSLLYLALQTSGEKKSVIEGEKTYLVYKRNQGRGNYTFSPENAPTSLWFEAVDFNSELEVTLNLVDDEKMLITSPIERHKFVIPRKEEDRSSLTQWEIGGFRVDASLFGRQQANWLGPDLFLQRHGGEEFGDAVGRQRINFPLDNGSSYFVFVKEGDYLIWKDEKWQLAKEGMDTTNFPLVIIKREEDRIMHMDFWSADGKNKIALNLLRNRGCDGIPDLAQEFRFLGAKTWAQFIVECRGKRFILRPNDWLVCTQEGWQKISSAEEIDNYVNRKTEGVLFVLDQVVRKEGKQVLLGHAFNSSCNEVVEMELLATSPLSNEKKVQEAPKQ